MSSPSQLARRIEGLETKTSGQEPEVIVCEESDYERLHTLHPGSTFIIDNIPKSIKAVQNNVVIYEPGTDQEKLRVINPEAQPLFFIPDNRRD